MHGRVKIGISVKEVNLLIVPEYFVSKLAVEDVFVWFQVRRGFCFHKWLTP
jgi:hypothetical protein